MFSDNHDEDEEEETTSVYTTAKDNETLKSAAKKSGCSAAVIGTIIVRLNEPKDGTRMFQTSKYKIFWRECASLHVEDLGDGYLEDGEAQVGVPETGRREEAQLRSNARAQRYSMGGPHFEQRLNSMADLPYDNFYEARLFPDWLQKLESARRSNALKKN